MANTHLSERGVYAIECSDGRSYIGASVNVLHRWGQHRSALRLGKSKNRPMQDAYNRLGAGAFSFKLLELVPAGANIFDVEQRWIDAARGRLFNVAPQAGTVKGLVHSAESRARQSASQRRRCSDPKESARRSAVRIGICTGEKHPATVLRNNDIFEIRRLRAEGIKLRVIGERFGVSVSTVSRIALGRRWQCL